MPPIASIEVIDLLHQREAEFIRVWECEQKIRQILDMPDFPFPPPPDLPSRRKRVKPAPKKATPSTQEPAPSGASTIRKLVPGQENAYRLCYVYNQEQRCSFQIDRELVRTLLSTQTADFTLLSVETVLYQDDEHWEVIERLYTAPQSP